MDAIRSKESKKAEKVNPSIDNLKLLELIQLAVNPNRTEAEETRYAEIRTSLARSMILRGAFTTSFNDWLHAVLYFAELDSAQYDTTRNLTQRSMMLRGTMEKYKYLGEN